MLFHVLNSSLIVHVHVHQSNQMFFALDAALSFHCPAINGSVVPGAIHAAAQLDIGIHVVRYNIEHKHDVWQITNKHLPSLAVTIFPCIESNAQIANIKAALQASLSERYVDDVFHLNFVMLEIRAVAPIPTAKPSAISILLATAQTTIQPA